MNGNKIRYRTKLRIELYRTSSDAMPLDITVQISGGEPHGKNWLEAACRVAYYQWRQIPREKRTPGKFAEVLSEQLPDDDIVIYEREYIAKGARYDDNAVILMDAKLN